MATSGWVHADSGRAGELARRLARLGRAARTGIAFAVFGAGGVFFALLLLPVLRLLPGTPRERELRCQRLVHRWFRLFVRFLQGLGLLGVETRGGERLREPGQLVVANHPTLLDVVMLVAQMPQADCVVKRAAWSNPFMRSVVKAAGYVPNDLGEALIEDCAERLAAGRTLLFFPEGTRSPERGLGAFRRGAAHVALRAGRPILPVFIHCDPPTLMRGQPWYDVPERSFAFRIQVGDPIPPAPGGGGGRGAGARRLTAALRGFYQGCLDAASGAPGAAGPTRRDGQTGLDGRRAGD
jgi:1-acyl-sn-glycerol-3-phosphate acyltransferase